MRGGVSSYLLAINSEEIPMVNRLTRLGLSIVPKPKLGCGPKLSITYCILQVSEVAPL